MRIVISLFLLFITTLFACNNDISTIGEDFVESDASVQCDVYKIFDTYTIRLDSFPTSSEDPNSALALLPIGIANDNITGTITSIPYLQMVPTDFSHLDKTVAYDSLTLSFSYNGNIWGDTTRSQIIRVYQTDALPSMNNQQGSSIHRLLYNVESLPYSTYLDSTKFLPYRKNLKYHYFRLKDKLGEELLEKMKYMALEYKGDYNLAKKDFVHYFKNLVLVPDSTNTCIFDLNNHIDSVKMTLHYHIGTTPHQITFNRSDLYNQYTFINMVGNLNDSPYGTLKTQQDQLDFIAAKQGEARIGQAVTEGMFGLMIKLKIPIYPAPSKYSTIIKAELVFRPQDNTQKGFQKLDSLYLYQSNSLNQIVNGISTCRVSNNLIKPNQEEYVMDITSYYLNLCTLSETTEDSYVMASINANDIVYSFDRLVIDEYPELRVYYTYYDMHE